MKTSKICNIKFSDRIKSCKVVQKNSFFVEKNEYVFIPLVRFVSSGLNEWRICKTASEIWGDAAISVFSKEGYYSSVIKDVVRYIEENPSIKICSYISLPTVYHKVLSVDTEKCFIEVCKWNYSNKPAITRAYTIPEIHTKGFKEVEIIASLNCRIKYEVNFPVEEFKHDCWDVYKFLLIWGCYKDIDQVWRGLPYLKKNSISSVLDSLKRMNIVFLKNNKWMVDREKLINRIKGDRRPSSNYVKQFLDINPIACKEMAVKKLSGLL